LITTAELASWLDCEDGRPAPTLLDVRWRLQGSPGAESYAQAHLPGAVFLDIDADLAAEPGERGRHPLPEPAALQRTLRAARVGGGAPAGGGPPPAGGGRRGGAERGAITG
jgi:thiosulfate/3-mercaptopyruvate sulfurtransferase